MNRYTIYCSEEQTKKAFVLGAPIIILPNYEEFKGLPFVRCQNGNEYPCQIPTAEQMVGWLRTNGFRFKINESEESTAWQIKDGWKYRGECATPKEATLAAIDAALDCLSKNK